MVASHADVCRQHKGVHAAVALAALCAERTGKCKELLVGPVRLWAKHSSSLSRWTSTGILMLLLALALEPSSSNIHWLHPASPAPQQDTLYPPVLCIAVKLG